MAPYKIEANNTLRTTKSFFRQDNILVVGSRILEMALGKSVVLFPLFIYDYYTGYSGVQRIGYFAEKQRDLSSKIKARAL
jgi:hypothetical protein